MRRLEVRLTAARRVTKLLARGPLSEFSGFCDVLDGSERLQTRFEPAPATIADTRARLARRARAHQWRPATLIHSIKMASLRLLARAHLTSAFRLASPITRSQPCHDHLPTLVANHSTNSYGERYDENKEYPDFEVSQNPKEWKYVERLLPLTTIPKPAGETSVDGWKQPTAKPGDYPYFIRRTKSHMIPVYLERSHRGMRRVTKIRKIEGDIWAFSDELKAYLEKEKNMHLIFQINEFAQFVKIKTDVVTMVRKWMYDKGF